MTDYEAARLMRAMGHAAMFVLEATGVPGRTFPVDRAGCVMWRDRNHAERRELLRIIARTWTNERRHRARDLGHEIPRADRRGGVAA